MAVGREGMLQGLGIARRLELVGATSDFL